MRLKSVSYQDSDHYYSEEDEKESPSILDSIKKNHSNSNSSSHSLIESSASSDSAFDLTHTKTMILSSRGIPYR